MKSGKFFFEKNYLTEKRLLKSKWGQIVWNKQKFAKLPTLHVGTDQRSYMQKPEDLIHTCRNTRIWGSRLLVKICLTSPGGGFDVASETFDVAWEHLTSPERLSTSSDRIYSLHSIPLIHYNYVLFLSYSLWANVVFICLR